MSKQITDYRLQITEEILGRRSSRQLSTVNCQASTARGFTLLIAVLVSGVLLAIGVAIFNIVSKQVILTSAGRESQFAFFAADTGVECVLYWDTKFGAFSSTSAQQISCAGTRPITDFTKTFVENPQHTMTTTTTEFSFSMGASLLSPCTDVKVVKSEKPTRTTIDA